MFLTKNNQTENKSSSNYQFKDNRVRKTYIDTLMKKMSILEIFGKYLEISRVVLLDVITILMISANLATLGLLKKSVFWKQGYGITIYFQDAINKTLSHDPNYIVDVAM